MLQYLPPNLFYVADFNCNDIYGLLIINLCSKKRETSVAICEGQLFDYFYMTCLDFICDAIKSVSMFKLPNAEKVVGVSIL